MRQTRYKNREKAPTNLDTNCVSQAKSPVGFLLLTQGNIPLMTEVCRLPGGFGISSHLLDSMHIYPGPLGFLQLSSLKSYTVF